MLDKIDVGSRGRWPILLPCSGIAIVPIPYTTSLPISTGARRSPAPGVMPVTGGFTDTLSRHGAARRPLQWATAKMLSDSRWERSMAKPRRWLRGCSKPRHD